jgi:hypothetical protein
MQGMDWKRTKYGDYVCGAWKISANWMCKPWAVFRDHHLVLLTDRLRKAKDYVASAGS